MVETCALFEFAEKYAQLKKDIVETLKTCMHCMHFWVCGKICAVKKDSRNVLHLHALYRCGMRSISKLPAQVHSAVPKPTVEAQFSSLQSFDLSILWCNKNKFSSLYNKFWKSASHVPTREKKGLEQLTQRTNYVLNLNRCYHPTFLHDWIGNSIL